MMVAPTTEPKPQAIPPMKLAKRTSRFLTPWLAVSFLVPGAVINKVYSIEYVVFCMKYWGNKDFLYSILYTLY